MIAGGMFSVVDVGPGAGLVAVLDAAAVAEDRVLAVLAVQEVCTELAVEVVVVGAAPDGVVAVLAVEHVLAVVAEDRVGAEGTGHLAGRGGAGPGGRAEARRGCAAAGDPDLCRRRYARAPYRWV